jgi:hypothetical protein
MLKTRLRNLTRYAATLDRKGQSAIAAAQYQSRSEATGNRKLTTADGGVEYGRFLSNSAPVDSPVLAPGRLGSTGFVDQKPA